MDAQKLKAKRAERRQFRVRKAIHGTAAKPRLSVFRSNLAHLRPADRRPERRHAGRGVEQRQGARRQATAATSRPPHGRRQEARRGGQGQGHHPGRVRPRPLPLPRPRQGAGRGRDRGRAGLHRPADAAEGRRPRRREGREAQGRRRKARRREEGEEVEKRRRRNRDTTRPPASPATRIDDMARERRDRGDSDSRDKGMVDFVVKIRRSACVVKGGRRFSFNALVVVGDKQRQGRLRLRQGQRSAAGRREGDQGRRGERPAAEEGLAARQHDPAPRHRPVTARAGSSWSRPAPAPA